jgi:hypothetical protein
VIAGFPICVTDDVPQSRAFIAEALEVYGGAPAYRAMLDREGVANPEDVAIIGDETAVTDRLAELETIGIDEVAAFVIAANPRDSERTRALLRTRT